MKKYLLIITAIFLLTANMLYAQQRQMQPMNIKIGTSDKTGGLYPMGISIAKVLNIPVSFLVYDYQNTENNKKLLSIVMKLKNYSIEELENIDNIINDIKRIEK